MKDSILKTRPIAKRLIEYLGITKADRILDYGCGRGFAVRVFRELGYCAFGISEEPIDNCDKSVKHCLAHIDPNNPWYVRYGDGMVSSLGEFDWVLAVETLAQLPQGRLQKVIDALQTATRKGIFVIVPLSADNNGPYVAPDYEKDPKLVQRRTLDWWTAAMVRDDFSTTGVNLVKGMKQNYAKWPCGHGFIIARRLVECETCK